jgi:hypothetical protein
MNKEDCDIIIERTCDLTAAIVISLDGKSDSDIDKHLSRDLCDLRQYVHPINFVTRPRWSSSLLQETTKHFGDPGDSGGGQSGGQDSEERQVYSRYHEVQGND